jgi:PQQ-dependent dehydrogenase (methanol/ethanol family)
MQSNPFPGAAWICSLALAFTACAQLSPPADSPDPAVWAWPAGDAANTRHSALTQITPANVGQLQPAWHFATGAARGQEGGPLIVGDTLYLHTPFPNRVVALSLADQHLRWSYTPQQDANVASLMCCDVVSRGLAYGRGKLFLQQGDGALVALDARSGARLWQVQNSVATTGATATNAPLVMDHYVVTGVAGGEYGVRGHLTAYDADTGRLAWRGYSTGPDADMLIDPAHTMTWRDGRLAPVGRDSSLQTWKGEQWKLGGGTTWGWIAYDAALRLVYYGSGNPGPWNALQRPGDNKWTMSLWARDVDTGQVRWVYQMTPHDEWDYDGVNETILVDGRAPARADSATRTSATRKLLVHFDRNGFAYTLDRQSGELLGAEKFDPSVNWATHVDLRSGRPVVDPARSPVQHGEDTTTGGVCPPAIGSKNQAPAAYDPALRLFFVPTNHLCMDIEPFHVDYTAGQPYVGATIHMHAVAGSETQLGSLTAWDAAAGRIAWRRPEAAPVWSGALSTASGLVFYGTLDGRLKALDAKTGDPLWLSPPLPSGVVGNVTTWAYEGRQYVGVLTGVGGLASDPDGIGGLRGKVPAPPSRGEFVVFALPPGEASAAR